MAKLRNENVYRVVKSELMEMAKNRNLQPRDRIESLDRIIWLKLSAEDRKDFQSFRAKKPLPIVESAKEAESPETPEEVKQELPSYL